jgi:predicted NBD/HSP70 family sugar kinase
VRLGIDIGGTKTDAVAIDDEGGLAHRIRLTTGFGSVAVVETALTAVARISELTGLAAAGFDSIGIGIPGMVDRASGHVAHAVNLGLDRLELGGELAGRLGVGVRIENDVNAAALGAYHLMGLEGTMAYLNLGTGLAAGIVVDGKLWRGARGIAGEIGHIPVDPQGPRVRAASGGAWRPQRAAPGWPGSGPPTIHFPFAHCSPRRPTATRMRGGSRLGWLTESPQRSVSSS